MTQKPTEREIILKGIITDLTNELKSGQDVVFEKMSIILGRKIGPQNFNGIFGSKNNTYVDSVRAQFLDFESFFASWMKGLNDTFEERRTEYLRFNKKIHWDDSSVFRMVRLLKDEDIYQHVRKFLERNFYKNLDHRTRIKPDESLWTIWFGYKLIFGILIAPVKRSEGWTNDKSEIRRAKYNYWTVGHVMNTGLIDPELDEVVKFNNINDFYTFYQSVIKRLSSSTYEHQIYDLYIDYLKNSPDVNNEPLLIPEFRYKGLLKEHEHRLDFTILNPHTNEFTGFEISPASSHMSVANLKAKQVIVNDDLKIKWEKEMAKRNKYFETFGITTITFTDKNLEDIPNCFKKIKHRLANRPQLKLSLQVEVDRMKAYQ